MYRDLQVLSVLIFFGYKTTLCGVLLFLVDYLVRDRSRSPEVFLERDVAKLQSNSCIFSEHLLIRTLFLNNTFGGLLLKRGIKRGREGCSVFTLNNVIICFT